MTTVHSNTEPKEITIDKIEAGVARLLVHWNIKQVKVTDQVMSESHQEWQYSERIVKWILPQKYDSIEAVKKYLTSIQAEIMNWAEATELNTVSGKCVFM